MLKRFVAAEARIAAGFGGLHMLVMMSLT